MINQDLYIEILELFDLIKEEEIFIEYKKVEKLTLENKEIVKLINEYNEIVDSCSNISYTPYLEESEQKLTDIQDKLNRNELYQRYLNLYDKCNKRLSYLSELMFKDIINVGEVGCCGHHKG